VCSPLRLRLITGALARARLGTRSRRPEQIDDNHNPNDGAEQSLQERVEQEDDQAEQEDAERGHRRDEAVMNMFEMFTRGGENAVRHMVEIAVALPLAIAIIIALALVAATPAVAIEGRIELPEEMVASWSKCSGDAPIWRRVLKYAQGNNPEILDRRKPGIGSTRCSDGAGVHVWENGYSGSGRGFCEFDKIEKTASGAYLVHANCKGQSGIEGEWEENLEFQIIDGYLVITELPEG
jgi:hypothetical protein